MKDERVSHQVKIYELSNKVTLLNSQFSRVVKQVKVVSTGIKDSNLSKHLLTHFEKENVMTRGVKSKENNYLWAPQSKSQTSDLTRMSSMMLEHQVTLKGLNISHLDSMNDEKSNHVSCSHKEQLSSITIRILEIKQLDELNDKLEICPHKKLKEINNSMRVVPHSLVHTNPVFGTHALAPEKGVVSTNLHAFNVVPSPTQHLSDTTQRSLASDLT